MNIETYCGISSELADFFDLDPNEKYTRKYITDLFYDYIQNHNLQNPNDPRIILHNNDNIFQELLGLEPNETFTYFDIHTKINNHCNRTELMKDLPLNFCQYCHQRFYHKNPQHTIIFVNKNKFYLTHYHCSWFFLQILIMEEDVLPIGVIRKSSIKSQPTNLIEQYNYDKFSEKEHTSMKRTATLRKNGIQAHYRRFPYPYNNIHYL